MRIPITRPCFTDAEARAVAAVLESGWVSQGPRVVEFGETFARAPMAELYVPWAPHLLQHGGQLHHPRRPESSRHHEYGDDPARLSREAARLALDEKGKELHLEIVNKALAFGYRLHELPATIEWQDDRRLDAARKSSSRIPATIHTHLLFSVVAAPFRYLFVVSSCLGAGAVGFEAWAFYNLFTHRVAILLALPVFFLALFAVLIFAVGGLASQNSVVQRELWTIQAKLRELGDGDRQ